MTITFQNNETTHTHENSGTLQLQLDNDVKKALYTLTGGTGDATDAYEPDF